MSNQITAYFKGRTGVAEPVYQNDYGMVLNFDGIYLPSNFDCHFSVLGSDTAIPGVGADNRVAIPNTVLSHEGNVTVHIPLHTGSDDSEVEYVVYFKVIGRARPEDDGTPVQMTAIERALALLSQPITNIEEIVNEALSFTGETFDEMRSDLQGDYDTFTSGVNDDIEDMQEDIAGFKTEIRGNISDVESNFTVLQGQFDTAVAGVTTDTEVTDIRVGADGVTDTTAGASVRRQFTNLKSEINELTVTGNFLFTDVTNVNNWENGNINSSGADSTANATARLKVSKAFYSDGSVTIKALANSAYYYVSQYNDQSCTSYVKELESILNDSGVTEIVLPEGYWYRIKGTFKVMRNPITDSDRKELVDGISVFTDSLIKENAEAIVAHDARITKNESDIGEIGNDVRGLSFKECLNLNDGVYGLFFINSSGTELPNTGYSFTNINYLPVIGGKTIEYYCLKTVVPTAYFSIYDTSKAFIERVQLNTNVEADVPGVTKQYTLPNNAGYIRMSVYEESDSTKINTAQIAIYYSDNSAEAYYMPYKQISPKSILNGIHILYDGDSICESRSNNGGAYAKLIAEKVGCTYTNYGVSGAVIVDNTVATDVTHHIVNNIASMSDTADLVCLEGGINDYWRDVPLGTITMTTVSPIDTATFIGALESIFRQAQGKWLGIPICFVIPHKISNTWWHTNNIGLTFQDYYEAIVAVCDKYCIPRYDGYRFSGLNGYNDDQSTAYLDANPTRTPDGTHPNEEGYKRYYVRQMISLFESILPID